ncbi:DUF6313 family protein [Streptomyces chartreusis]
MLRLSPGLIFLTVLYLLNGFLNGWGDAYNLLVTIDAPGSAKQQWCAWPLSMAGWLVVPALVGGTIGYAVTEQIENHRSRAIETVLQDLLRHSIPPPEEEE